MRPGRTEFDGQRGGTYIVRAGRPGLHGRASRLRALESVPAGLQLARRLRGRAGSPTFDEERSGFVGTWWDDGNEENPHPWIGVRPTPDPLSEQRSLASDVLGGGPCGSPQDPRRPSPRTRAPRQEEPRFRRPSVRRRNAEAAQAEGACQEGGPDRSTGLPLSRLAGRPWKRAPGIASSARTQSPPCAAPRV